MDLHVLGHFRKLIQSTIHEKYPQKLSQTISDCLRPFTEALQTVYQIKRKFEKSSQLIINPSTTTKNSSPIT